MPMAGIHAPGRGYGISGLARGMTAMLLMPPNSSGFGWIATISKPRLQASIKLNTIKRQDLEPKIWSQP